MKHLTLSQYRNVDLTAFAVILTVFDGLIATAATRWFPGELYTVSAVAAVCSIVLMRWGGWAAIHAVLGGVVFCIACGGTGRQLAIYAIGNLGCLGSLLLLKWMGPRRIREDKLYAMLFGLVTQLLMQLGRALVALALGTEIANCVGFLTTDALSDLFTMVILYIARQLDGVFENQKDYLIRLQAEQRKEKGGF